MCFFLIQKEQQNVENSILQAIQPVQHRYGKLTSHNSYEVETKETL